MPNGKCSQCKVAEQTRCVSLLIGQQTKCFYDLSLSALGNEGFYLD